MDRTDSEWRSNSLIFKYFYSIVILFFRLIILIFFRAILCIRSVKATQQRCFQSGTPVIFAIGLHANQFVDPLLVTTNASRKISMLIAKVSTERPLIGFFARILSAIPVERRTDSKGIVGSGFVTTEIEIASEGKRSTERKNKLNKRLKSGAVIESKNKLNKRLKSGTVIETEPQDVNWKCRLRGTDSLFLKELSIGDFVSIGDSVIGTVEQVVSNSLAILHSTKPIRSIREEKFLILPKIDHSRMYQQVTDRLAAGGAIGIFPEGGSHDQPFLQPFHSGVAIMALESVAKHPHLLSTLKIVPVGLNYFHRNKFRSRATVEFGDPISLSPSLLDLYLKGGDGGGGEGQKKKQAISLLSSEVRKAILLLTVNSPSSHLSVFLNAACRMFKPNGRSINSIYDRLDIMKQFSQFIPLFNPTTNTCEQQPVQYRDTLHSPQSTAFTSEQLELFKEYYQNVVNYLEFLTSKRISLRQIENYINSVHSHSTWWSITKSWLKVLLFLPGFLLHLPCLYLIRRLGYIQAEKARRTSPMKAKGIDVVATWKMLIAFHTIPLQYLLSSFLLWYYGGIGWIGICIFITTSLLLFAVFVLMTKDVTLLFSQATFQFAICWYGLNLSTIIDQFNNLVIQTNQVFGVVGIAEPENPIDDTLGSFFDYESG